MSELLLKVLGFLWLVFLARFLTVELFGRYSFINAFIALFSFLPDLGVGLIIIREIARQREKAANFLGSALLTNSCFSLLTVGIIALTTFLFGYEEKVRNLLFIASLTLFFSSLRSVAILYFDGTEKMHMSSLLNALNTLLLVVFASIGLLLGFGLPGVFMGMLVGTLVSLFMCWGVLLRRYVVPRVVYNVSQVKSLILAGLPLGLASFAFLLYAKIDTVLLGHLLNERAVGVYSSATPFVFSLIQLLNVPFMVAVYPALSRLSREDSTRFAKASKKSFFFVALWSIPLALFISFFSPFIIPLVFSQKYQEAVPVLRMLIFFVPFASLSALLYKILIVLNRQNIYLAVSIVGAILNILANVIFIPKYGVMGAAYASVLTQVVLFICYFLAVNRCITKSNDR